MADLASKLRQDRTLRNAAKRLIKTDIAHVRGDVSARGIGGRAIDRMKDGAAEIADDASDYADTHRGQLGAGIALAVIGAVGWFFRDRLADAIYDLFERFDDSNAAGNADGEDDALPEMADALAELTEDTPPN